MVDVEWIVFPVENGLELVIDSTDELVLAQAKAAVAASHPGYLVRQEWIFETGDVILLVPAPVAVESVPQQREFSVAEEIARAAHPAFRGRANN